MPTVYIYSLSDPETGELRYIGKSASPRMRLSFHMSPTQLVRPSHKNHWLKALRERGVRPILMVLEEWPDEADAALAEQRLIAHYRALGARLTNGTDGGEGASGHVMSERVRAIVAEANRRRPMTDDRRAKLLAAARIGRERRHAQLLAALQPCVRCGDPAGPIPKGSDVPQRTSGVRFGFTGDLCRNCYGLLQNRERSAHRRQQGLPATETPRPGLSCGLLSEQEFMALYPITSNPDLARLTGLGISTVASRGRALGLHKTPEHLGVMQAQRVAAVQRARAAVPRTPEPPPQMILCSCGCGMATTAYDARGRPKRFAHGHNGRGEPRPAHVHQALHEGLRRFHAERRRRGQLELGLLTATIEVGEGAAE